MCDSFCQFTGSRSHDQSTNGKHLLPSTQVSITQCVTLSASSQVLGHMTSQPMSNISCLPLRYPSRSVWLFLPVQRFKVTWPVNQWQTSPAFYSGIHHGVCDSFCQFTGSRSHDQSTNGKHLLPSTQVSITECVTLSASSQVLGHMTSQPMANISCLLLRYPSRSVWLFLPVHRF